MQEVDCIAVHLATDACVTIPKSLLRLGVKFLDFNSVERCLVFEWTPDMISFSVWLGLNAMSHGLIEDPKSLRQHALFS